MKPKKEVIRKVVDFGNSRAVILPKPWLKSVEEKSGRKVMFVRLRLEDVLRVELLTVEPIFAHDPALLRRRFSFVPDGQGDKP